MHNLPTHLTSFVGRARERHEVTGLVRSGTRLVTLIGPGGVGKTRLALEVAAEIGDEFAHGAWLIEFGPLADQRRVSQTVAAILGVQEEPGRELIETLVAALRTRHLLLVLDNCEHLVDSTARLAMRLASACPKVSILASSRQPLALTGETTWLVPPLDGPDSMRLFADRATAASRAFDLNDHADVVARICQRLDGNPLALELAAARVPALGPRQLAARLDDRFRLLAAGSRTAPPRQQTLRAVVDWSYDLLDQHERRLFERLAVFAGGWSLEAAEWICNGPDLPAEDIPALLAQLVDKSLVIAEDALDGTRWYRLLETIRAYAIEKLAASIVEADLRARHLDWYARFAEHADHVMRRAVDVSWRTRWACAVRVTHEMDNIRAAFSWSIGPGDALHGMRMAGSLLPFFYSIGYLGEGRDWLARLLEHTESNPPSIERALALGTATKLAAHHGDDSGCLAYAAAYAALPEAVHRLGPSADRHAALAMVQARQGDLIAARGHAEEAVALALENGDPVDAALFRNYLAAVVHAEGTLDEAEALYRQSLADTRRLDFALGEALSLDGIAAVARARGDLSTARRLYHEALDVFHDMGAALPTIQALLGLGYTVLEDADRQAAWRAFDEALNIAVRIGQRQQAVAALSGLARVTAQHGPPGSGVRLTAVVERARSGDITIEDASACVREAGASFSRGRGAANLTERERQVAELLASGLSNRAIAEQLVISIRTVDRHVENMLARLGLSSRTQVAAWFIQQQAMGTPIKSRSDQDWVILRMLGRSFGRTLDHIQVL